MFDPGGCSGRLRAYLFLGERHALLRWGFVWDAAMLSEAGAFLLSVGLQHHFQDKDRWFGMPYVITLDHFFPEARNRTGSGDGTSLWKLRGMNGW